MFRIYEGESVVVEGESPLTITGLDPNEDVAKGAYQAVRIDGDKESERVDIPAFKTLPIKVESVTIAPKTNNLDVDATRQLNVTIEPSNATNQDVAYTSDDEAIATVDANGLVTAIAEGTATITATIDGKTDTATINVTDPDETEIMPTSIEISPKTHTFTPQWEPGVQKKLTVTISPEGADKGYTFESSDKTIADTKIHGSVYELHDFFVTAEGVGTATITVTSVNGLTASCEVTVPEPE